MQIVVNDLLTTYSVSGSGTQTVVLIHGWADSHATFEKLQASLAEMYKVVSFDLPGSGGTDAPMVAWDLHDFAVFTAAFLQKVDIFEPYALIGHSNGGAIIIRGLAHDILRADKLVLLASAGIRNRQKSRKLLLKAVAKTGKAATIILPGSTREKLRRRLYKAAGSDMLVAEHLEETFKKTVGQDVQADARRLALPTLLVYGDNDTATPPAYGALLHTAIKGSTLIMVPGAGHFMHREQPARIAQEIRDFLK